MRSGDRWTERLTTALGDAGLGRPDVVHSLADAEIAVAGRSPELVVFDPAVVGADFDAVARDRGSAARYVGWLGSRASPVVATLLDAGAEDVLDASMGDEELVARVRRCLVRSVAPTSVPLEVGGLRVDVRARLAEWDGRPLGLTRREVEVLQVLVAAYPRPVRCEELYRLVWGWTMPRGDRAVDVNVKRLRDKLARAGAGAALLTEPGVGYRLRVETEVVTGL